MSINFLAITAVWIAAFATLMMFKWYRDKRWSKTPAHNFPFIYRGKKFWFSRTVGVSQVIFAKNKQNMWCILAKQRGKGNSSFPHMWTLPCAYIDFNQTGEQATQKETYESTHVFVPLKNIKFFTALTSPSINKQNVELVYYTIIENKTIDDIPITLPPNNLNVTENAKWIPINNIQHYNWAFDHDDMIMNVAETLDLVK